MCLRKNASSTFWGKRKSCQARTIYTAAESDEEYETGRETNFDEKKEICASSKRLRDRSTIRKPEYFGNYMMSIENFLLVQESPESYEEAMNIKHKEEWKKAMESEMNSLKENKTWELTTLPKAAKALPSE